MNQESLLSDRWFESAGNLVGANGFGDVDLTAEYRCVEGSGLLVHHQVFARGRLVRWRQGSVDEPELVLRQPLSAHLAMLSRRDLGNGLLCATEVIDLASGESSWPPPLDEVHLDWGGDLPLIPAAGELVVQQVMVGSPFGTVDVFAHLREGRVIKAGVGSPGSPDIRITRTYAAALRHRAGELDALVSVEGGEVVGGIRALAVFLGIFDAEECVEARRRLTTACCEPLIRLGDILCSTRWTAAAAGFGGSALDLHPVP